MQEEIKNILKCLEMDMLDNKQIEKLLDYITNLQEKLEVSQTNEETYRLEMQDITKCLCLKEDTIFDEVKEYATNLQEENERLKQIIKTANIMKYFKAYDILQGVDKE